MKKETKPSNLGDNKLMVCNKNNLPKDTCVKIDAAKNNLLDTKKTADASLIKKIEPDVKLVEDLSAKEQAYRMKFKEKFNKLRKLPIPPSQIINMNSETFNESNLTIENVKRKLKQIFCRICKEPLQSLATPELRKHVLKKQSNDIKVCVKTKPMESALYYKLTTWILPMKKCASEICKSLGFLPEGSNNEQIVFVSKEKSQNPIKSENNALVPMPIELPSKKKDKENPAKDRKIWETNEKVKPLERISEPEDYIAPTPRIDLASDDISNRMKVETSLELIPKDVVKTDEMKTVTNVRGGILSRILKKFIIDSKLSKPKSWFSRKNNDTKLKIIPYTTSSKVPLKWRHGFVILGTIIPLYYTYYKIVSDNRLTVPAIKEN